MIALISLTVLVLDILTKQAIVHNVALYDHIDVLPFLRIVHVENTGAAFGLFSGLGNNIFIFVSVFAIIFVLLYLLKIPVGMELVGLSLILGGAGGNLVDRLKSGKVIDFIDLFLGGWHWPAFNVADSALTIGIILFLISTLRTNRSS